MSYCLCGVQETCYQYWPPIGSQTFGEFTVELLQEERLSGFSIRSYGVYNEKVGLLSLPVLQFYVWLPLQSNKFDQVNQFHITNWAPDGHCSNIKSVTDVIEEVGKVQRRTGNHPIVVHCRYANSSFLLQLVCIM